MCSIHSINVQSFFLCSFLIRLLLLYSPRLSFELMLPPTNVNIYLSQTLLIVTTPIEKARNERDAKFGHDSSHDHLFTKTKRKLYFFYFCNKLELSENIYSLKRIIWLYKIILRTYICFCNMTYEWISKPKLIMIKNS